MMNEKREEKFKVKKQKQSEEAFSPWFNEPWILTFVRSEKHNLKHTQL